MRLIPRHRSRLGFACLLIFGLIAALHGSRDHAYPLAGQDIYYNGGSLQIEILPSDSAYTSQVFLYTDAGRFFLGDNKSTGVSINLSDPSALGLSPGEEFVLGIHVLNTGSDFVMGGAYDNPDGVVHAKVNYRPSRQIAMIGFEDLSGGGDLDYNDVRVRVVGNIGIVQIPEPSSQILFGAGLLALVVVIRRSRKNRQTKKPILNAPNVNR